jgi:uncharacterized membrane protein YkvA (DUF1232 family)
MKKIEKKTLEKICFIDIRNKVVKHLKKVGQKLAYTVLLLVFAFRRKETPAWAKHIIVGAIGYFLTPFDSIPDLTPILGYTDDLGVLSFGLVTIASYIDDGVRIQARKKLKHFFGSIDFDSIEEIDAKL